ncbi:putative colanic acid biosynthesis UDP-glucose lipid carrier transferase [Flavobacterium sp. 103]|uniref:exopolysaccharide biosynthesis polyprenyl glycosylphosphotransferase n=1 Tax=unclassified Flavobacterium TaxID=196869 RepID=UPI000D5C8775|nr:MULTISPECIES: exopolysaccharide biosynthesis polyprenyl glycosylphosphotransferase [unclassified Flavobacterium]PVX45898.1 putative colanic acid biosynthesis UDP-glucose lipid carrier transferase [Flavobacterium sp. 103]QKJ61962.1 exopolysaccharide biosynthesis polyprenyl glycosylphosphotransferase [Flavobacterium sp. M31R6]
MKAKTGRYSGYIRPFSRILDLIIINFLAAHFSGIPVFQDFYALFISCAWFIIAANLGFYEVYRYTKVIAILNCTLKQAVAFTTCCLALAYFYPERYSLSTILLFTIGSVALVLGFKLFIYFFLRKYRIIFGGNFRTVVLVGKEKSTNPLQQFFEENPDYGYKLIKVFDLESHKSEYLEECFQFILDNKIDEIYCSMTDLLSKQIEDFIFFADNNLKTLKFIPNQKQLLSLNSVFEYYDYIPVISQRTISLDESLHKIIKRIFDVVFSTIIILGILSWLTPILAIIIKIDSKGPLFFVQKRNGLNSREFNCFKFRSMEINELADIEQVSKNDARITKVGKFIRKTSMDELPQFFNVLLGDMSVVGPRPHMVSHTNMYAERIDKFMVRHFIKPGITGLAQTKGFRGEVETDNDIINRVRYDIFYIEKWSLLLDFKIIFNTIYNTLKGDKKAY